jgi:glycosyltransferase involved in cell wall biosynthesis
MSEPRLAFFDDYPNADLGHHPELILGLAGAAAALRPGAPTRLHCPASYVAAGPLPPGTEHVTCEGRRPYTRDASRANLRRACRDAERHGAGVLVNLFLDENYRSFPVPGSTVRLVHVLHRPGPRPRGPRSRRPLLAKLFEDGGDPLVVVHTARGLERAAELAPRRSLVRIGWPSATRAEVADRFARARLPDGEPYVLLIGGARPDKGIHCLLRALESGPRLAVVGEQEPGLREALAAAYPRTRVDWRTDWMPKHAIDAAIAGASAVVLPYEDRFAGHAGASGALAQALTHAKPLVLSSPLADQAPASEACIVVPPGDERSLRRAVQRTIADTEALHLAALERRDHVAREHTYEGHVERMLERLAG